MQRFEVSGAVRPIYGSLGVKRLSEAVKWVILPVPRNTENILTNSVVINLSRTTLLLFIHLFIYFIYQNLVFLMSSN